MADRQKLVESIKGLLSISKDSGSPEHDELLSLLRELKQSGLAAVQADHARFAAADNIYRAFRQPDEEDKKAAERKEPRKIIYPVAYAQLQTLIATLISVFDRRPFFELEARRPDYQRNSKLFELELQYQLDQMMWPLKLYQWLKDAGKYGFGKVSTTYEKKLAYVTTRGLVPIFGPLFGLSVEVTKPVTSYEGNVITVDDPYSSIFDPNVSVGDIQRGQFVIQTVEMSYNDLKLRAETEGYFNLEDIPKMDFVRDSSRRREAIPKSGGRGAIIKGSELVTVDFAYVKLVPSDYKLSELDRQQLWKIVMVNEARIIKAEPTEFEHGLFPCSVIEYDPDIHELINVGLLTTIEDLGELLNWFLNSHVAAVRKVINDVLIVDETGVNIDDIENRRNVIRMKPAAANRGVDRYIKQLQVNDVTQAHVGDAAAILQMIQRTTGISDNFMGVQLPTTRTATEVSQMNRLAASRIRLLARTIFAQGLMPLGQQMIQNTQQFMSTERFLKVSDSLARQLGMSTSMVEGMLRIGPENVAGNYTIAVADFESPADKIAMAAALRELFSVIISVPQIAPALGANLSMILSQILVLLGIKNVGDFINPPSADDQRAILMSIANSVNRPISAKVMPDEEVEREFKAGNLIPEDGGNGGRARII